MLLSNVIDARAPVPTALEVHMDIVLKSLKLDNHHSIATSFQASAIAQWVIELD